MYPSSSPSLGGAIRGRAPFTMLPGVPGNLPWKAAIDAARVRSDASTECVSSLLTTT